KESIGQELQALDSEVHHLIDKYNLLYQIFGESRCLVEYRLVHSIKENSESLPKHAIISLVEYDKCFDSNEKFGFVTESIESHENQIKDNLLKYHQMNLSLLGDSASRVPFDSEVFLYFHKSFKSIFQLLETEKSLQN